MACADIYTMQQRHTMLFIHGFPLDATLWDLQVKGLSGHANVLAPDLRGCGADDRTTPTALTMELLAGDLKQLLDEHGAERAVLCGLSMGGYVAMAFLELWPERVAGLVLCNTRSTADDAPGKKAREETANNATEKGMDVIARGMMPKLLSDRTRTESPDVAARIHAMIARQRPATVAALSRGMAHRPDRTHILRTAQFPTLVMTGEEDLLMPLPTSTSMVEALPRGRLVVIPGAAHLSNVDAPELFNAALTSYLSELDHA